MSNKQQKALQRKRRLANAKTSAETKALKRRTLEIMKENTDAAEAFEEAEHQRRLRQTPMWWRVLKAILLVLGAIVFLAILTGLMVIWKFDIPHVAGLYTFLGGTLAVISLVIAFVDGEPRRKSKKTKPSELIKGTIRTAFSKDGLNIAGIVFSLFGVALIAASFLTAPDPVESAEMKVITCNCGGVGAKLSYR